MASKLDINKINLEDEDSLEALVEAEAERAQQVKVNRVNKSKDRD